MATLGDPFPPRPRPRPPSASAGAPTSGQIPIVRPGGPTGSAGPTGPTEPPAGPGRDRTLPFRVALGVVAALMIGGGLALRPDGGATAPGAVAAEVTVDFGQAVATTPRTDFGTTISGYGNGSHVANDEAHQARLRDLGVGLLRIEMRFREPGDPASGVRCNSLGCAEDVTGEQWVAGIEAVGAEPLLVLPIDPAHPVEQDAADAVALARFFADQGVPIRYFVVGNEPDLGGNQPKTGVDDYSARFNAIADALHGASDEYQVGGPTLAGLSPDYVDPFLRASGDRLDFYDLHRYGRCGDGTEPIGPDAYREAIGFVQGRLEELVPDRADEIGIQVGEYNSDCDRKQPGPLEFDAVLWTARVLGTILATDARAIQFSDKNEGLGLVGEGTGNSLANGEPQPAYHGIGMFTGEGRFRRFGETMVAAESSADEVDVFASTGEKNVVLVNAAGEGAEVDLRLTGLDGDVEAAVWRSTEGEPAPTADGEVAIAGGAASVTLPARSVTTLVVAPDVGAPDPSTPSTTTPTTPTTGAPATTTPSTSTSAPATTAPGPEVPAPEGLPETGEGLKAEYFPSAELTGTPRSRVDDRVLLDHEHEPFEGFPPDGWGVRWTGWVRVDRLGDHVFTATSAGGIRVTIDGGVVVDAWDPHDIREDRGTAALTAGWHQITVEYQNPTGVAYAKLAWAGPGFERVTIPADHLRPAA